MYYLEPISGFQRMKLLHDAQIKPVCKVAAAAASWNASHGHGAGSHTWSKTSFIAHIDNADSFCTAFESATEITQT